MAIIEVYTNEQNGEVEFVGERPSIIALIIPAAWLIWHRLWYELIAYGLVAVSLGALSTTAWALPAALLSFLPGLYLYLEGQNLVTAKLERQGYSLAAIQESDNRESAELWWFAKPENRKLKTAGKTVSGQVWPHRKLPNNPDAPNQEFGMFGASQ